MKVGDLVRYLSRTILVIDDSDKDWVVGLELGENELGRYKRRVLRELPNESR